MNDEHLRQPSETEQNNGLDVNGSGISVEASTIEATIGDVADVSHELAQADELAAQVAPDPDLPMDPIGMDDIASPMADMDTPTAGDAQSVMPEITDAADASQPIVDMAAVAVDETPAPDSMPAMPDAADAQPAMPDAADAADDASQPIADMAAVSVDETPAPNSMPTMPDAIEAADASQPIADMAVVVAVDETPAPDSMPAMPDAIEAADDASQPIADMAVVVAVDETAASGSMQEAPSPGSGTSTEDNAGEAPVVRIARDPRLDEMAPNASMEDLLKASEQQYRSLKHGDVIEGSVMKVDRDEILVDIGSKSEGIIPSHELQSLTEEERQAMQIGDPLLVSVVQPENNEGHAVLSLDRARQEKSWRDLQKKFEDGEVILAEVSGYNKGGLLVNLTGVRGFVPSSQVSSLSPGEANKQSEMSKLQGQKLPLKIIEINRGRNRLILSERQAVQEQREGMRSRLLKELESGQVRPGTVSSICDFGAFVDIGGADGLIHLSELSWKRVSHPRDVLSVGDRINVYVLSVDPNERKIALSFKRTQPEPWTTITENYQLGQLVKGTITQLTSFGAFARLEDGIEGLIHVSELAEGRVAHPKNVVKEGDVVELKVIRIDPARKRIGLSLKRVNEDAEGVASTGVVDDETTGQEMEAGGVAFPNNEQPPAQQAPKAAAPQPKEPQPQPQAQAKAEKAKVSAPAGGSDEPMSAMAHAFAKHAQSQQAAVSAAGEADEAADSGAAPIAEAVAPEAAPAASVEPEASMPPAPDMDTAQADSSPTPEPEASDASPSASDTDTAQADSGTTPEPEMSDASPSASDTDTSQADSGTTPEPEMSDASPSVPDMDTSQADSGTTPEPEMSDASPSAGDLETSEVSFQDADTGTAGSDEPAAEDAGEGDASDHEATPSEAAGEVLDEGASESSDIGGVTGGDEDSHEDDDDKK